MNISYVNLGTRKDKDTGEVVPNLPKNDSTLQVVDFKSIWVNQENLNQESPKGTDGMIFPFDFNVFYSIDAIKEKGMVSNGLVFIDIDCGKEYIKPIFDKIDDINSLMGGPILTAATTGKGLHVICVSEGLTEKEYAYRCCDLVSYTAYAIMKVTGIDLRKIEKAIDPCTFSIKQRFFLRYSPSVYWHEGALVGNVSPELRNVLKKEYPLLYKKVQNRYNYNVNEDMSIDAVVDVDAIFDVPMHDYIEHQRRWMLFDSLCCCYSEDLPELERQWRRCAELITPGNGHSTDWFINEPKQDKWYKRWLAKDRHYCDCQLLQEFGYNIKSRRYVGRLDIEMPSNINELMNLTFNI